MRSKPGKGNKSSGTKECPVLLIKWSQFTFVHGKPTSYLQKWEFVPNWSCEIIGFWYLSSRIGGCHQLAFTGMAGVDGPSTQEISILCTSGRGKSREQSNSHAPTFLLRDLCTTCEAALDGPLIMAMESDTQAIEVRRTHRRSGFQTFEVTRIFGTNLWATSGGGARRAPPFWWE